MHTNDLVFNGPSAGMYVEACEYKKWSIDGKEVMIVPDDRGVILEVIGPCILVAWDKYPNLRLALYLPEDVTQWPVRIIA